MKMFFCNSTNFGDALNKYIFKKIFNVESEYSNTWDCDSAGIGSILESFLWQTKDIFKIKFSNIMKPVAVLSSGLSQDEAYYKKKLRFYKTMRFKRKMTFVSLRGKLTQKCIEKITASHLDDVVLGDLGLLASELITPASSKKYDIGICPHFADMSDPIFKEIYEKNSRCTVLNTRSNPIEFLRAMSECETVISTGLHPLIAADSLGIPNLWGRISENTTPKNKFWDYYSIYDIKPEPIYLRSEKISSDKIKENYCVDNNIVSKIKEKLYTYHVDYFKDLG